MDYKVKHGNTYIPLNSSANKSMITAATQSRKLCGDDTVKITLQSAEYINFAIGDTIDVFGTTYTINQLPTVKRNGERDYEYTLVFEGLQYALIDRVFLMPDNTEGNNLMFDLAGMMAVLITNINRGNSGKPYVLGTCPADTEYKNLSLTEKNCLQVLQQLCQEWDTEFTIVEGSNQITINIGAAGTVFGVPFTYGRNGGIYNLNREKGATDVITRLFCYGGTQNLTWYRHNRLCLPSKTKNQSYIEDSTAQATYGIKEAVKNFDEIYPNRIGEVSSVSGCEYNEFIDTSMADSQNGGFDLNAKWTANDYSDWLVCRGLTDSAQNQQIFANDVVGSTRYLINGQTAKIHFNSGALAGYEVEIHSYDHATQKFVLQPLVDENGYDFPSKTNTTFRIAQGDKYIITDINLPESYKQQAETQLASEAATYFATVCTPQPKYSLEIDSLALQRIVAGLHSDGEREVFKVGDSVHITDADTGVDADIRIDRFERDLIDTWKYKLTLTDEVTYTSQVRTLIELNQIKRVVQESGIADPNKIRRGWKDAEELYNMVFDTEGQIYGEKIQPLSIDTTMLKVGARSQQLTLQNVTFQPNYLGDPAKFEASAGYLVHLSIDESGPKTWTMSALSASSLSTGGLYLYARCSRSGNTGTWVLSNQAITFDSESGWYNFLIGTLGSVDSNTNTRTFSPTYGFSTINGRYIKTGRVQSADGQTYFDLDQGVIGGNIEFQSSGSSYDQLQQIIGNNTSVQTANATANRAEGKIDGLEVGGRNMLPCQNFWEQGNTSDESNPNKTYEQMKTNSSTRIRSKNTILLDSDSDYTVNCADGFQYYFVYLNNGYGADWSGWKSGKYTFKPSGYNSIAVIVSKSNDEAITPSEIENVKIKLEKGNKATDWTPAPEDTEAELTALQSDLQGQIDSKIETWSQVADPSTAWTTTALKDQHVGDLWYYTGETTSTRTNNKTYKYTKSGSTYTWTEHSAGGGDLFDKIDGKSTIFYGSPSGTYAGVQTGDFLVDSDTNICYKWSGSAWVKVQDVQVGGRNLLPCTDYWEQGSCISGTGQTWEQIKTTTNTRIRTINTQSVETNTDYTISIGDGYSFELDTFLNGGWVSNNGGWKTGKITFNTGTNNSVAFLVRKTDNSTILPSEIVNAKIKFEKGNRATDWTPAPEDVDAEIDEQTRKNLQATCSTAAGTANKDITCSDWKDSFFKTGTHITIEFTNANTADYPYLIINGTTCFLEYAGWLSGKLNTATGGHTPKWVAGQKIDFVYDGQKSNTTPSATETHHTFKIEDETAFKANLILAKSIEGTTDIEGGLVLTNTIMLRNAMRQFTAGMSGLNDDGNVAIWAGGTLQDAIAGIANAIIRFDGSAKFGVLLFDENGNISMPVGGKSRLSIFSGNLPSTDVAAWSYQGYAKANGSLTSGTGTRNTTITLVDYGTNRQGHNGMVVSCTGTGYLGLSAASGTVTTGEIQMYIRCGTNRVPIWKINSATLTTTTQYFSLSSINAECVYFNNGSAQSIVLEFDYVLSSGTVNFNFYDSNKTTSGNRGIYVSWNSDVTTPKTNIAANGLLVLLKNTDYFEVKESGGKLYTTIKGKTNISGVLWAGTITSGSNSGSASTKFANNGVTVSVTRNTTGDYTISLSGAGGNTTDEVSAFANVIKSNTTGNGWSANIIGTPTKGSIRVKTYSDNTITDTSFTLCVIGYNY